jgi:hypothetical protein
MSPENRRIVLPALVGLLVALLGAVVWCTHRGPIAPRTTAPGAPAVGTTASRGGT